MPARKTKTAGRPTHAIEYRAETDGVAKLSPSGFHSLLYSVKCTQCGLARDNVRFDDELQEIEGSRGTAHFIMSCKDCERQCTILYVSAHFDQESSDYNEWQRLVTLDCRGCCVVSVHCDDWDILSESGATWKWNVSDDFFEYDEDLEKPVTVSRLEFQIVPI
jgi:hypothetical protein